MRVSRSAAKCCRSTTTGSGRDGFSRPQKRRAFHQGDGCSNSLARMNNVHLSSLPGLTRQSMLTRSKKTYWIYILASRPRGTLYVGMTNDLVRRIYEHREGLADSFTKEHRVKMLVFYEQRATAIAAIQREKNIKHWSRKWEIDLIRSMKSRPARRGTTWGKEWGATCGKTSCVNPPAFCAALRHGSPGQARW